VGGGVQEKTIEEMMAGSINQPDRIHRQSPQSMDRQK